MSGAAPERSPVATVWLTGLPAAGKSTVGRGVVRELQRRTQPAELLDGDELRQGVNAGLGFGADDRSHSVRRAGELALELTSAGVVAVVAMVSPFAADRQVVRASHEERGVTFLEVWLSAPLSVCEARDPKGLYRRARSGELPDMTGVDQPYEAPSGPELTLDTSVLRVDDAVGLVVARALGPSVVDAGDRTR